MNKAFLSVGIAFICGALILALVSIPRAVSTISADGGKRNMVTYGLGINPIAESDAGLNIYGPGSELLARVVESSANYRVADHLSSSRLVVDAASIVHYEYGPHGEIASGGDRVHYAGHPYDAHQSSYSTPARTYDPSVGRFLSLDSRRQGASPYPYGGNNPIINIDFTGDIYVPFFIYSGFAGQSGVSSTADSIKNDISPEGDPHAFSDHLFFDYHINPPGQRFMMTGAQRVHYDTSRRYSYYHGDVVYWLVGAEEDVRTPLGVREVFQNWRSLRFGIASRIVIIDVTGQLDRSRPIRGALDDANIRYAVLHAEPGVRVGGVNLSTSDYFIGAHGITTYGFRTIVGAVAGAATPQVVVPPAEQITYGRGQYQVPIVPVEQSIPSGSNSTRESTPTSSSALMSSSPPSSWLSELPELLSPLSPPTPRYDDIGPEGLTVSISRAHWDVHQLNEWVRTYPE